MDSIHSQAWSSIPPVIFTARLPKAAFVELGTVFQMSPQQGGGWSETVLHSFNYNGVDGANPYGGLILDAHGNLYSTTNSGGISGYGAVFEISPRQGGGWSETVLHSFENGSDEAAARGI